MWLYFLFTHVLLLVSAITVIEEENDMLRLINSTDSDEIRLFNLIYPGTKWCGVGDVANGPQDVGKYERVDVCCREHDTCPDSIKPGGTKHGLKNNGLTYRFACTCEVAFYRCLKSINTKVSNQLGRVYFTVIGGDCFRHDFPIIKCDVLVPYTPVRSRCLRYSLDNTKSKKYQFFNLPFY